MTDRLEALLADLVADAPPARHSVTDLVDEGLRIRRRRRPLAIAAVGVAMLAITAALGLGPALLRGGPGEVPASSPTLSVGTSSVGTSASVVAAGERIGDPGFEATPPGWAVFGPATVLTPTGAGRGGRQALVITSTGQPPVIAGATNNPVRTITAAGTVYQASCWVRSDSVIKAFIQVQEYSQSWQRGGDPKPSTHVELTDPTQWYRLSVTYTAAHDGNLLPLSVLSDDLYTGGPSLVVDDCSLTSP